MPKVRRVPLPIHVVVPDTNILWDKDKKNSVSPDFDAFWEKSISRIRLTLAVPEVVCGELHFQQATSAIKAAETVLEQIGLVSGITNNKYETPFDHQKIRKQVGDKLQKWVKGLNGVVIKTPVGSIDWSKMVQDAIWRNEPFTSSPKDKGGEKGFRDALILETLVRVCEENKENANNIVFLCNDYLLKTTAENRLKQNRKVLIFESLTEFDAYIKLTQQQLTDKFVKSIQYHARSKFFVKDDRSTIFYRDNIKQAIKEKFSDELTIVTDTSPYSGGLLRLASPYQLTVTNEIWWISATRFDELIVPREYHWISRVTVARLLNGSTRRGGLAQALLQSREEIQLIGFDIKWKANVKADGRFHDISVIEIVKAESKQEPATEDAIARWKLQRIAAPTNSINPAN